MKYNYLAVVALLFINAISTNASFGKKETIFEAGDHDQEILAGTWRGRSVCVSAASGCHDEEVIYHIAHDTGSDHVEVNADKIVDGKVINMGALIFTYNKEKGTLFSNVGKNSWQFNIKGNQMEGVLLRDGEIFRKVNLTKD